MFPDIVVLVVEVSSNCFDKLGKLVLVFRTDAGESERGGGLLVDDLAKSRLALDNAVRHVHLVAQGREPKHEFDGIDVVCNNYEKSLLLLDEIDNVVQAVLDEEWLFGVATALSSFRLCLCELGQSLLLGGLVFRLVLLEHTEELGGKVLIARLCELRNGGRDLESLSENLSLPLESNVLGPFDESGEVSLWLDILSDSEILWPLFEQRMLWCLFDGLLGCERGCGDLLALAGGLLRGGSHDD